MSPSLGCGTRSTPSPRPSTSCWRHQRANFLARLSRLRARPMACDASLRELGARERIVAPAEIGSFKRRPFAGCAIKCDTTFEYRVIERHLAVEDRSAKPRFVGEAGGVKARAGPYGHSF